MQQILNQLPYARFLGLEGQEGGVIKLPYGGVFIGNPILPALHGGVTASVLQIAAQTHVIDALSIPLTSPPKLIDFTVDYLRRGLPEDGFAKAQLTRAGRRFASVSVTMWQGDPDAPIAAAHGHFALVTAP